MGFDYSLNPYRGCAHGCRYCYARASHQFLQLNVGNDFEEQLFVKENLPQRLQAELPKVPQHRVVAIGTVTDPYQPLEGRHQLTRQAIILLANSGHPFTITTKSPLILRDRELLEPLGRRRQVQVNISLMSLSSSVLRQLEPGTASPSRRLQVIEELSQLGIPVGVFMAPIVPTLTDEWEAMEMLFARVSAAGAQWLMASTMRLSAAVKPYFLETLAQSDPVRARRIADLYGEGAHVPPTYYERLHWQLDQLYRSYPLSATVPRPLAYVACPQVQFEF